MAVVYHCQRAIHRIADRDRFDESWAERARTQPDFRAESVDEALFWLDGTVAAMLGSLTKKQLVRAGFDDDRWERMSEQWRAALERGDMTGTVVPAGDGYVMHAHVFPIAPK